MDILREIIFIGDMEFLSKLSISFIIKKGGDKAWQRQVLMKVAS